MEKYTLVELRRLAKDKIPGAVSRMTKTEILAGLEKVMGRNSRVAKINSNPYLISMNFKNKSDNKWLT